MIRYGKGSKLVLHFIGPFDILERIGLVAYHLAFLPSMSHIHDYFHVSFLRLYHPNLLHVLDWTALQVEDGELSLEPMPILQHIEMSLKEWSIQQGSSKIQFMIL